MKARNNSKQGRMIKCKVFFVGVILHLKKSFTNPFARARLLGSERSDWEHEEGSVGCEETGQSDTVTREQSQPEPKGQWKQATH